MATAANNDVVDNGDFKQLSGTNQFTGASDVRIGWLRVPTWMVVHQQDPMGGSNYGGPVNFSTMNEEVIQRADRDQLMPLHAFSGVEQEHHEAFPFGIKPRV